MDRLPPTSMVFMSESVGSWEHSPRKGVVPHPRSIELLLALPDFLRTSLFESFFQQVDVILSHLFADPVGAAYGGRPSLTQGTSTSFARHGHLCAPRLLAAGSANAIHNLRRDLGIIPSVVLPTDVN